MARLPRAATIVRGRVPARPRKRHVCRTAATTFTAASVDSVARSSSGSGAAAAVAARAQSSAQQCIPHLWGKALELVGGEPSEGETPGTALLPRRAGAAVLAGRKQLVHGGVDVLQGVRLDREGGRHCGRGGPQAVRHRTGPRGVGKRGGLTARATATHRERPGPGRGAGSGPASQRAMRGGRGAGGVRVRVAPGREGRSLPVAGRRWQRVPARPRLLLLWGWRGRRWGSRARPARRTCSRARARPAGSAGLATWWWRPSPCPGERSPPRAGRW